MIIACNKFRPFGERTDFRIYNNFQLRLDMKNRSIDRPIIIYYCISRARSGSARVPAHRLHNRIEETSTFTCAAVINTHKLVFFYGCAGCRLPMPIEKIDQTSIVRPYFLSLWLSLASRSRSPFLFPSFFDSHRFPLLLPFIISAGGLPHASVYV